jgi:hypothetical protein
MNGFVFKVRRQPSTAATGEHVSLAFVDGVTVNDAMNKVDSMIFDGNFDVLSVENATEEETMKYWHDKQAAGRGARLS